MIVLSPIKCPLCDLTFKLDSKLNIHLKSVHLREDFEQLYVNLHYSGIIPRCQCWRNCEKKLTWYGWRKGYRNAKFVHGHNERNNITLACPSCNKNFAGEPQLVQHLIENHNVNNIKELYVNSFLNGITPRCKCGKCDKELTFKNWRYGFGSQNYVHGHNPVDTREWKQLPENKDKLANLYLKSSQTLKDKFIDGTANYWRANRSIDDCKLIQDKITCTRKKNYSPKNHPLRLTYDIVISRLNENLSPNFNFAFLKDEFEERVNNVSFYVNIFCTRCNWYDKKRLSRLFAYNGKIKCPNCDRYVSEGQKDLYKYVTSLGVQCEITNTTRVPPYELDVLCTNHNLAIEYNGLYWHSSAVEDDQWYHEKKKLACEKQNVSLIQVYEDEWYEKQEIVKSIIKNRLKLNETIIYARNCTVKHLSSDERKKFFDENHLEGDAKSTVSFGLLVDNVIVSAISVRKPFHVTYQDNYEIARFATKTNCSVLGGLSKLIKHVKCWCVSRNVKKLITYVDTRFGSGDSYVRSGFKLSHNTSTPRFWWTDTRKRFNRFEFKATKTESQADVAMQHRIFEIFGCTNKVFVLEF